MYYLKCPSNAAESAAHCIHIRTLVSLYDNCSPPRRVCADRVVYLPLGRLRGANGSSQDPVSLTNSNPASAACAQAVAMDQLQFAGDHTQVDSNCCSSGGFLTGVPSGVINPCWMQSRARCPRCGRGCKSGLMELGDTRYQLLLAPQFRSSI